MTTKTDEQERALLPCPFCGSTNIEVQISTPDREGVPTNLMCSDCGASGPWEYEQVNSHAKADAAWNRRAALQSQEREDAGIAEVMREAAQIISAISPEHAPKNIRWPIVDELEGFASMIDHARRIEEAK